MLTIKVVLSLPQLLPSNSFPLVPVSVLAYELLYQSVYLEMYILYQSVCIEIYIHLPQSFAVSLFLPSLISGKQCFVFSR